MSAYPVPTTLSPSRIESFLSCPLAFRFVNVEKLPDPPTVATTKGSLVHRALEVFFGDEGDRSVGHMHQSVDTAIEEYSSNPDLLDLELSGTALTEFVDDCRQLALGYLAMEDPSSVRAVGLEMRIEAAVGPVTLRGIIDPEIGRDVVSLGMVYGIELADTTATVSPVRASCTRTSRRSLPPACAPRAT